MGKLALWTALLLLPPLGAVAAVTPAPRAAGEVAPRAAVVRTRQQAWWNREAISTELDLTEQQRTRMDEILASSLRLQDEAQQKQREARRRFDAALEQGDFPAARRQAPGLGQAVGNTIESRSTLMIDLLAVLTAEQRRKLLSEHPGLLRQPWEEDPRPRPGQRIRARRRPPPMRGPATREASRPPASPATTPSPP